MIKNMLPALAFTALMLPSMAAAQTPPAPVVVVVDVQRASSQCNSCRTALAQLETQVKSLQSLQASLETPLRTEASSIQTAVNALNGRTPDAALQARITAFERKQGDAQRQLATREQTFQRNREHVLNQIRTRLDPALTTVMTRRNANVMLDAVNVIKTLPALDATNDLIAALNTNNAAISTTAPAAAAPAGR